MGDCWSSWPKRLFHLETGSKPKVWDNRSRPAWLLMTKSLPPSKKPSGPFVQTTPCNLVVRMLTWLWYIFCIWRPSYVPSPKSLFCKQVLEDPEVFPDVSRESSLLRWRRRLLETAGECKLLLSKISYINAKQNCIQTQQTGTYWSMSTEAWNCSKNKLHKGWNVQHLSPKPNSKKLCCFEVKCESWQAV